MATRLSFPALLAAILSLVASAARANERIPVTHAVLVHGIWQHGDTEFKKLRRELETRGVHCVSPTLKPMDGRDGLEMLGAQLKNAINEAFGEERRYIVIAFSMGGLVSRYHLQDLGGASRCDAFFTISTPHQGTRMAWLHYGDGAKEMRPGSVFLNHLIDGESRLGSIPIISYRTPHDMVIVPSTSSVWDRAENVLIKAPTHQWMTRSTSLIENLLGRLQTPKPAGTSPLTP